MLDDLNELKTFRAILIEGSLSAAARRLGITLAVVSKRLATLEGRAGVLLIQRTTRAMAPTAEGARLLLDVERALDALEAGEEWLASGRDEPVGLLRISAAIAFGRRCVVPVAGNLARQYRRLSISLELDDRLVDLVGEGFDVAVRIGALADTSLTARKIIDNRRVLVAAPSYLDAAGRPGTPADLTGHDFLRYGSGAVAWRLLGPDGATASLAALARLHVDDGDAVHRWCLDGLGIMLKSQIDVATDLFARRLERVLPGWYGGDAPVMALYPSNRHVSLKVRVLLDALKQHAREILGEDAGPQ